MFQEEQNRGKPNWEHLNDELHVLITVEDSENRAQLKLERAVDEVKKLLTVVSKSDIYLIPRLLSSFSQWQLCTILARHELTRSRLGWRLTARRMLQINSEGICLIAIKGSWRKGLCFQPELQADNSSLTLTGVVRRLGNSLSLKFANNQLRMLQVGR